MINLPSDVPEHLVEALKDTQHRIRILMHNHTVLRKRMQNLNDANVDGEEVGLQLQRVEQLLLHVDQQQRPIIDAIRQEIRANEKLTTTTTSTTTTATTSTTTTTSTSVKTSTATTTTTTEATDSGRSSASPEPSLSTPSKKMKASSDESASSDDNGKTGAKAEMEDKLQIVEEGQYKAYVTDVDKITAKSESSVSSLQSLLSSSSSCGLSSCLSWSPESQMSFLQHVELLPASDIMSLLSQQEETRSLAHEYRSMSYVPEMVREKKQRFAAAWLNSGTAETASPPSLRTRRRNVRLQEPTGNTKGNTKENRKGASKGNGVASLVMERKKRVRMPSKKVLMNAMIEEDCTEVKRGRATNKSSHKESNGNNNNEKIDSGNEKNDSNNDSEESNTVDADAAELERLVLRQNELNEMRNRIESKFTVATRKDRTLLLAIAEEQSELESRLEHLQSNLQAKTDT